MNIQMRAKLVVTGVEKSETAERVTMRGVSASKYGADGLDENNTFAKFSPAVDFSVTIANPALFGKHELGQEYYADFTPVAPKE